MHNYCTMSQNLFWLPFLNRIIFFQILFQKCKCIHVLQLWAKFYWKIPLGKCFFKFWSHVAGISEKISRVFKKHRFSTAMKPHCMLRNILVHPKDKRDPLQTAESNEIGKLNWKLNIKLLTKSMIKMIITYTTKLSSLERTIHYALSNPCLERTPGHTQQAMMPSARYLCWALV